MFSFVNIADNERLKNLINDINDNITAYVDDNPHLLSTTKADRLKDADNRRWNIIKIQEILLNKKNLSSTELASRILEHITSEVFTTGSVLIQRSVLRDSLLETLETSTPEIFTDSHFGFASSLPQDLVLNIQPDDQVNTEVDWDETAENDEKQEYIELKNMILDLNKIFRDYIDNQRHIWAYHDRRYNIQPLLDIITIPDGDLAKFDYFTAEEVALRIYEHISSVLCPTFFGSTFRNDILSILKENTPYLRDANKPTKAYILNEADRYHRFRAARRLVNVYNKNLIDQIGQQDQRLIRSTIRRENLVIARLPRYRSFLSTLQTIITDFEKANRELNLDIENRNQVLTEVKIKLEYHKTRFTLLTNYINRTSNHVYTPEELIAILNPFQTVSRSVWLQGGRLSQLYVSRTSLSQTSMMIDEQGTVASFIRKYEAQEEQYTAEINLLKAKVKTRERCLEIYNLVQLDNEMELSEEDDEKKEDSPANVNPASRQVNRNLHNIYRLHQPPLRLTDSTVELADLEQKHVPVQPASRPTV
jgi:hypothetical protein